MKQLVTAVLFLSLGGLAWAQTTVPTPSSIEVDKPYKSIYFKTNPFTVLQGPIPFTAEYRFGFEVVGSRRLSYQLVASYLNKSPLVRLAFQPTNQFTARDIEFPGYRLQAQVRYFVYKFQGEQKLSTIMVPNGFYLALQSSYAAATLKLKSFAYPRQDWTNFNVAGLWGMQLMADDIIGIDFFFGLGYKRNTITEIDDRLQRTALDPRAAVSNFYGSPLKIYFGFNVAIGLF